MFPLHPCPNPPSWVSFKLRICSFSSKFPAELESTSDGSATPLGSTDINEEAAVSSATKGWWMAVPCGVNMCQFIYTRGLKDLKEGNVQWENYISMFQTQFLKLDASFDPGMPWDAKKKGIPESQQTLLNGHKPRWCLMPNGTHSQCYSY